MTIVNLAEELETSPATLMRLMIESKLPYTDFYPTDRSEELSAQGADLLRWFLLKDTQPQFVDELYNLRSKLRQRSEEVHELTEQIQYYLDLVIAMEKRAMEKKNRKIRKPYKPQ